MTKKPVIAIHSYSLQRLDDTINFASILKNHFDIIFVVENDSFIPALNKANMNYFCIHCNKKNKSLIHILTRKQFIFNFFTKLKKFSVGHYLFEYIYYHSFQYYANIGKKVFQESNIKLLITLADRHNFLIETGLLKACKDLNIPIFIPSIANWNPEANYLMIQNNPNYSLNNQSTYYQKKTFLKFKYQTYKEKYFYQAFMFNALDKLGVLSTMPWLNGGGASSLVVMTSKLNFDKHIQMGITKNKLQILGDMSYINLYKSFINKDLYKKLIMNKYNLKHEKKNIIIGLANWWEHNLADEKTHWQIVYDTIEPALQQSSEFNILISLHPSMKIENYKFLEKKYSVTILDEKLMNILPIADLYIADFSSTVSWSIICGIKTIVIKFYKSLNIFDDFSSLLFAENKIDLKNKIIYLLNHDISFQDDWDLLSKEEVFHGHIAENYIITLANLIEKS